MNEPQQRTLITILAIIIGVSAFTYGALTANPSEAPTATPAPQSSSKPVKIDLKKLLQAERSTIIGVLTREYPAIFTDYSIGEGTLYGNGEWYGTVLTYRGSDTQNRDTLRILMQKKNNIWTLRTTPPAILLSTVEYPDVPKSILDSINQPVSLPAGNDNSPIINVGE